MQRPFPCIYDSSDGNLVIAIPILILRQSQMRMLTKIGLGFFLCLSVFMLTCSIMRASGLYYQGALDFPWQVYWLHVEACIGVTMGSLNVYRSTPIGSNEISDKLQSYLVRIFGRNFGSTENEATPERRNKTRGYLKLSIPGGTLRGL
jgi:hypothetical protein